MHDNTYTNIIYMQYTCRYTLICHVLAIGGTL